MKGCFANMRSGSRGTTLLVLWLMLAYHLQAQSDWKFRHEKNGIKVYTRQQQGSDFLWLKSTFETNVTLSQYAAIVLNVENYKNWNFAQHNASLIRRISESELIYYMEVPAPWPITDRFMVVHLDLKQDPVSKTLTINLKNVPELMPEKKGFVRMKDYSSVLTVTPLSSTRAKIECIIHADPGGIVPAWAVNAAIDETPFKAFTNLKDHVKSQGANRESVPFIADK
jgi:hypothetical protein